MKSRVSKIVVAALCTALLLMNVGVVLSAKSPSKTSSRSALQALLLDSDSDEDTGSDSDSDSDQVGDKYKECGLDPCEIHRLVGIPPLQTTVILHGHFKHCKLIDDDKSYCLSSACDISCDAGDGD